MLAEVYRQFEAVHAAVERLEYRFADAQADDSSNTEDAAEAPEEEKKTSMEAILKGTVRVEEETSMMLLRRESFVVVCQLLLQEVELKGWMKPPVTKFISDVFYRREGVFNAKQRGELESVMGRLKNKFNSLESRIG